VCAWIYGHWRASDASEKQKGAFLFCPRFLLFSSGKIIVFNNKRENLFSGDKVSPTDEVHCILMKQ
jgi:hypothetical protein